MKKPKTLTPAQVEQVFIGRFAAWLWLVSMIGAGFAFAMYALLGWWAVLLIVVMSAPWGVVLFYVAVSMLKAQEQWWGRQPNAPVKT